SDATLPVRGTPRWTRARWQSPWTARPPWTDKLPTAGVDSRLRTPSRPDHRPTELKKAPDLEALSYFAPGILELTTRVRTFGGHHRALSHGHAHRDKARRSRYPPSALGGRFSRLNHTARRIARPLDRLNLGLTPVACHKHGTT